MLNQPHRYLSVSIMSLASSLGAPASGPKASLSTARDPSKLLLADASSIVDLKAEVFRKHQEAKFNKLHGKNKNTATKVTSRTKAIWSKANTGVTARRDKEEKEALSQSDDRRVKEALTKKAELYEKLKSGEISADRFLVEFKPDEDSDEESDRESKDYPAQNEGEEWVEYVDSLGRTRTCMKKDLHELKKTDRELKEVAKDREYNEETYASRSVTVDSDLGVPTPDLLSEDMRRELLRQKWEREEEANLRKRDVHYHDVLFDEARTHGAGFYKFSRNAATRLEEQDNLKKAHEEAQEARQKAEKTKVARSKALKARLRRVRERKRLKMGLPIKDDEENYENSGDEPEQEEEEKETSLEEGVLASLKTLREEQRDKERKATVREWDRGKEGVATTSKVDNKFAEFKGEKKVLSQQEWVKSKRSERLQEFAPPSLYEKRGGRPNAGASYHNTPPPGAYGPAQGKQDQVPLRRSYENTTLPPLPPQPPLPSRSQTATAQFADFSKPPPLVVSSPSTDTFIGPSPKPDQMSKSNAEDSITQQDEKLSAVSISQRLRMFREAADTTVHNRIINEVDIEKTVDPSAANQSSSSDDEEEVARKRVRAAIPPPCSMDYFSAGFSSSRKGTGSKGFRTSKAMADAFSAGLNNKGQFGQGRSNAPSDDSDSE